MPITTIAFAEQIGNTPESGATSRIKQIYDALFVLAYGDDNPGSWGDMGTFWNRIWSAAEWTPDGTATSEDVAEGETFYGSTRTEVTGNAQLAMDFELQILNDFDDNEGPGGSGELVNDYTGDESVWTNTATNVWKDERTGLYWSANVNTLGLGLPATYTNSFPNQDHSTCPYFSGVSDTDKILARQTYDGLTVACGNAINVCGSLSLDKDSLEEGGDVDLESNWYLPTQKEMEQSYIDGMFNQTLPAFTTGFYWTSTEASDAPTGAWRVFPYNGFATVTLKTGLYPVRCVSRD